MSDTVLVLGDSVPTGERVSAPPWPERLPGRAAALTDAGVAYHGSMGTTMADLAAAAPAALDERDGPAVAVVHAGHNDAQLSGGDPRVAPERFVAAAATLEGALADLPAVDRYAFVGLVPLTPVEGGVPLSDAQPGRALSYDDLLAETVDAHLPIAPAADWGERTVDGVHPDDGGHEVVAGRVTRWLDG